MTDPRQEGNRLKPYTTYLVTLMPLKVELRRRYSDFDALRNRAGVLTSVRNGKVLFRKKPTEFPEEMLTDKGI
mgnify:CR=1 FL=1